MIAIDPTKFNTVVETDASAERILQDVKASEPAVEGGEVCCPGERSLRSMKDNMENGIPVVKEIWNAVLKM